MSLAAENNESVPSPVDIDQARKARQQLVKQPRSAKFVLSSNKGVKIPLTGTVVDLLFQVIEETSEGNTVKVVPVLTELTTQQAAALLNVSRPFLINLLEDRKIPYRTVGRHRRILHKDLMNYKERIDKQRYAALDKLAAQAQKLNMGY